MNNADFLDALVAYGVATRRATRLHQPRPQVTEYLGDKIMKIATHLAYRPNFSNYTFRDEMISDGIENCLRYIDNFDPKKSKNPFAYFTQIIYFAFIRRIKNEKTYMYRKYKIIEHTNTTNTASQPADGDVQQGVKRLSKVQYGEWSEERMHDFIHDFETTKRKVRMRHRND